MNSLSFTPSQTGLTDSQMQTIKSFYEGLEQILLFEKGLSDREMKRLMRLSRENLLFVDDSLDAIDQVPELCTRFLDPFKVNQDIDYFHQLRYLEQLHEATGSALKDMRLILGDKCFRNGLMIYHSVKSASNGGYPKARPIYEQMRKRFDGAPPVRSSEEEESNEEPVVDDMPEKISSESENAAASNEASSEVS